MWDEGGAARCDGGCEGLPIRGARQRRERVG